MINVYNFKSSKHFMKAAATKKHLGQAKHKKNSKQPN